MVNEPKGRVLIKRADAHSSLMLYVLDENDNPVLGLEIIPAKARELAKALYDLTPELSQ